LFVSSSIRSEELLVAVVLSLSAFALLCCEKEILLRGGELAFAEQILIPSVEFLINFDAFDELVLPLTTETSNELMACLLSIE
jgi:hypothetical protein